MTEKEKMMAGIVYSVLDEELIRLHRACVDACALCDRLLPSQLEARREHLARILGKTGEHPAEGRRPGGLEGQGAAGSGVGEG